MYEVLESALICVCMNHGTMTLLRWYEHLTETADCNDIIFETTQQGLINHPKQNFISDKTQFFCTLFHLIYICAP